MDFHSLARNSIVFLPRAFWPQNGKRGLPLSSRDPIDAVSYESPLVSRLGDFLIAVLLNKKFRFGESASRELGLPTEESIENREPNFCAHSGETVIGQSEIGPEPEGVGAQALADFRDDLRDLLISEAIEKETGDDGVVILNWQLGGEDVGLLESNVVGSRAETFFGAREHGRAKIEAIDLDVRRDGDEFFQATAVAFSEDEDAAALLQMREQGKACAFEITTKGEIFESAITSREPIKVLRRITHPMKSHGIRGVSKEKSAKARAHSRPW